MQTFFELCEALLFASSEPLKEGLIKEILSEEQEEFGADFDALFFRFQKWINERESGLMMVRVAGGWQLVTRPHCADAVSRLKTRRRKARFSRAALEVLAIIAYRQPITTPEIETIRGVDSSGVLKNLLDKRMITILGRKKGPGNPLLYGTTQQFLLAFGLNDLDALPDLTEFEALIPREPASAELPFDNLSGTKVETDDTVATEDTSAEEGTEMRNVKETDTHDA